MQYADADIALLRKKIKPIYSSNVQGLLRTKIEAGKDDIAEVAGLPKLYFLCPYHQIRALKQCYDVFICPMPVAQKQCILEL